MYNRWDGGVCNVYYIVCIRNTVHDEEGRAPFIFFFSYNATLVLLLLMLLLLFGDVIAAPY